MSIADSKRSKSIKGGAHPVQESAKSKRKVAADQPAFIETSANTSRLSDSAALMAAEENTLLELSSIGDSGDLGGRFRRGCGNCVEPKPCPCASLGGKLA